MNNHSVELLISNLKNHINLDDVPSKRAQLKNICERLENGAFISYAQNYEDVILNRVFRSKSNGFYIDVGAYHPYEKSVTCLFSKRGWLGMNVDLCDENISRFEIHRPSDINVCSAVGSKSGTENFFVQKGTTRTTKDEALAKSYEERGADVKLESLTVHTLSELISKNNIKEIDFLSVDVEGAEADVFRGIDFEIHRPAVILAEATYPETNIPNWDNWNFILESAGYHCVYFDGLNRFYIEKNNVDLAGFFKVAPNYFDNFIRYENIINLIAE